MSEPRKRALASPNARALIVVACAITLGLALRLSRLNTGDYYEDGASHWWAAAAATSTGSLQDPFNGATSGYWLPGYDYLAIAVLSATGSTDFAVLRVLGLCAFVAAELALYALASQAGRGVGLVAVFLLAVSPTDIVNAPLTTGLEPAIAFLCAGLALEQRARRGSRPLLIGMSTFFTLAVLFRYEAVVVVGTIILHNWWWSGTRPVSRIYSRVALPFLLIPILVSLLYIALTPGENLPMTLLLDRAPDVHSPEVTRYTPPDPFGRNAAFWGYWVGAAPFAAALAAIGVITHFRRVEAWVVTVFVAVLSFFMYLNLGTISVRYILAVEPIIWFMAALGGRWIFRRMAVFLAAVGPGAPRGALRAAGAGALAVALIASTAFSGAAAIVPYDQGVALNGPLYRAAAFLKGLPQDPDKLVLVDSPLAAEASGLPAERMFGSGMLPADRNASLAFLKERVQYIVAVNVSYYRLIRLFPELSTGNSTEHFSLLYDATNWEFSYTAKTAFVYRVNQGNGSFATGSGYELSFPLASSISPQTPAGVHLLRNGTDLTGTSSGLLLPTLHVNGTAYLPVAAAGAFGAGPGTTSFAVTYTLLPSPFDLATAPASVRASVRAEVRLQSGGLEAHFTVSPPAGAGSFALAINNSLPDAGFPLTFNDSLEAPEAGVYVEGPVWSLQNWIIGDAAIVQFDFTAPLLARGGRAEGGPVWIAYDAPAGATEALYRFDILTPGTPLKEPNEPLTLKAPLYSAGGFLAAFPPHGGRLVLSDFGDGPYPYLAQSSGLPASAFANTTALPSDRAAALAWLQASVEYIVVINQTGDRALALFPELAAGDSTSAFSLAFDAGGPAGSLGEGLVWVYRVNMGRGFVPAYGDAWLTFPFEQDADEASIGALGLEVGGSEIVAPVSGFGLPRAVVNGTPYEPGNATLAFVPGGLGRAIAGSFQLFPLVNGSLDRSAPAVEVRADYQFSEGLLNVSFEAMAPHPSDNVTLWGSFTVPADRFPVYYNDTTSVRVTDRINDSLTWSIRNWFIGPSAAVQADFHDPYITAFAHAADGISYFTYEGVAGVRTLSVALWVISPAFAPAV